MDAALNLTSMFLILYALYDSVILNLIPLSVVKLHADLKLKWRVSVEKLCAIGLISLLETYKMNSEFSSNYSINFQNTGRTGGLGIVSCFKLHVQK